MFERLLTIGADFNSLDSQGRVRASLRFAATAEIPSPGEIVLLHDIEGNSCLAEIEIVTGLAVTARPEWPTWVAGDGGRLGQTFTSRQVTGYGSTAPATDVLGNQVGLV